MIFKETQSFEDRVVGLVVIGFWFGLIVFGLISLFEPAWLVHISDPGKNSEAMDIKHLGDQELRSKRYTNAAQYYRRAIEMVPDFNAAAGNLGIAYSRMGQHDKALRTFEYVLKLNPASPHTVYHNIAELYEKKGQLNDACRYYELTAKAAPLPSYAYGKVGLIRTKQGRVTDAISAFERSLQSRLSMADLYRGMLLEDKFNRKEDSKYIAQIDSLLLDFKPEITLDQYDTEVFDWEIKWDRELAKTYSFLGNAFARAGNMEMAASNYRKALDIWPAFQSAHSNLESVEILLERSKASLANGQNTP
ncbi:MAG: tetratricopeptide repeat protein [Candidatus Marinimicrobia bacterium]|nr:tetratricopeptide repeat protein [Candidatus Neomarinimicrobiota bacterium]